ncbi:MAG: serine hydrolase [Gemmataceae bacterium]|nr:serine hydrolase [Gemmataceae bacterium]
MRRLPLLLVLLAPSQAAGQPAAPPAGKYAAAVAELDALVAAEVADKRLPALSVALVDDQRVVWAAGYGFRDRGRTAPAAPATVYRVGSVSKLFTDVAVMRLVEAGDLDLDAPVTKYLPDFRPALKDGQKPISLRMLMAHRSGLVREPPVGNYFDPTGPSLSATVASLNGLPLIYPPGERTKYSNAAIGAVGYTLEKVRGEPFEQYVQRDVLDRLGMTASSFTPTPAVKKNLADAVMWTYHGREFPAPTFELGMSPAGCMYSTVLDLAKFASCLFAGGKAGDGQLLKPETIEQMFTPQFAGKDAKAGFGLGFLVDEFDGHKRVSHGGAIYGFATEWAILPAEKLGVVITCSRDVANGAVNRLADDALRLMLAAKAGKPLPKPERAEQLPADEARRLAGRYRAGDRWLDLIESNGRLFFEGDRGGFRLRLKKLGNDLITDDAENWGSRFPRDGEKITRGGLAYTKEPPAAEPPPEPPARWRGLIGEYGWDHNTLYVYEKDGRLHALIEWTEIDPLTEESDDVYAFPTDRGLYHGEKLVFARDKTGRATKVTAAGVVFERRTIDGEGGETFTITPQRPLDQLRREALTARPPAEPGEFRKPDLVDLATTDGMKFDIRYATQNNFLKTQFYPAAGAFLQRPAAAALGRVHAGLKDQGYGLLVYDAYRPWHVTRMFWDATPPKFRNFVADPGKGSRHNRGCAVDLTLYDLQTGKPVEMVSGYDEFSDRAFPDYPGGTSRQRWHRDLLRRAMAAEGFAVYEEEWWHFDYKDWPKYPILNVPFAELGRP